MKSITEFNKTQNSAIFLIIFLFTGIFTAIADNTAVSHYLFPAFNKGTVIMKSGIKDARLNYNIVTEEMVFEQNGKNLVLGNLTDIDTIILQNRKFVPAGSVFYEVLVSGPVTLFLEHKGKLIEKQQASNVLGASSQTASGTSYSTLLASSGVYGLKLKDDVEVVDMSVFLILNNGELNTVTNKKQFLKLFPEKSTLIEQYIKDNKLDVNKQDNLIKLVNYCNELYK